MEATQKQIDAVLKYIFDPSESNAKRLKRCKVNKEELDKFIQTRKIQKLIQQLKQDGGNPLRSFLSKIRRKGNQVTDKTAAKQAALIKALYKYKSNFCSFSCVPKKNIPGNILELIDSFETTVGESGEIISSTLNFVDEKTKKSPLQIIVEMCDMLYTNNETNLECDLRRDIITKLLQKGADPDYGMSSAPLFAAIEKIDIDTVNQLLQRNAKCNNLYQLRTTPLHYAIKKLTVENSNSNDAKIMKNIVIQLIKHSENINEKEAKDLKQNTALHLYLRRAKYPDPDIIKAFIEQGADISLLNSDNETASDLFNSIHINNYYNDILKKYFIEIKYCDEELINSFSECKCTICDSDFFKKGEIIIYHPYYYYDRNNSNRIAGYHIFHKSCLLGKLKANDNDNDNDNDNEFTEDVAIKTAEFYGKTCPMCREVYNAKNSFQCFSPSKYYYDPNTEKCTIEKPKTGETVVPANISVALTPTPPSQPPNKWRREKPPT